MSPTATEQPTATVSVSSKPGTPKGTLAETGASVLVPVLVAVAALGAGALLVRKRRQ